MTTEFDALSSLPLPAALLAIGWLIKRAVAPFAEQVKQVLELFAELVATLKAFAESTQKTGEAHAESLEAMQENTEALIENTQARKAANPTEKL